MKSNFIRITAIIMCLAISGVVVSASTAGQSFDIHVPFTFVAGDTTYSEGTYNFKEVEENVYVFRSKESGERGILLGETYVDSSGKDTVSLSFKDVGKKKVLTAVNQPSKVFVVGN